MTVELGQTLQLAREGIRRYACPVHDVFKALGDRHRYAMMRLLRRQPLHVQAIADALGITQPAVSRHARLLQEAGLIEVRRAGRRTVLSCPPPGAPPAILTLLSLIPPGRTRIDDGPSIDDAPAERPRAFTEDMEDYLL